MITRDDIFRNGITLDAETERKDREEFNRWLRSRGDMSELEDED